MPSFAPVYSSRAAAFLKLKKYNQALQVSDVLQKRFSLNLHMTKSDAAVEHFCDKLNLISMHFTAAPGDLNSKNNCYSIYTMYCEKKNRSFSRFEKSPVINAFIHYQSTDVILVLLAENIIFDIYCDHTFNNLIIFNISFPILCNRLLS